MTSDPGIYPKDSATIDYDWILRNTPHTFRVRVPIALVNSGFELLPARPGVRWRLLDALLIAVGGAVTGATDVRILGTRVGVSVALCIAAVAGLTQSAVLRAGAATVVVLADGASFTALDPNTAITVGKTGGSAATATAVDIIVSYADDRA
jgi:hypothetical protein